MEEITEYPQVAPARRSHRRLWAIAIGSAVAAAVIVAGAIVLPPTIAAANQAAYNTALVKAQAAVPAAPIGDATTADEQQTLSDSDTAGAQAIATEQAKEAAAALAAEQAAAAAAAQHSSDSYAPGEAPAGTRIPTHLDTDPNSGTYGQQVIEDPGLFCASHAGNTVNGVAVCA